MQYDDIFTQESLMESRSKLHSIGLNESQIDVVMAWCVQMFAQGYYDGIETRDHNIYTERASIN